MLVDVVGGARTPSGAGVLVARGQSTMKLVGPSPGTYSGSSGLQRDEDRAAAALGDEVEAVVEELAEEGHPGVERSRQAGVGRQLGMKKTSLSSAVPNWPSRPGLVTICDAVFQHVVWPLPQLDRPSSPGS